MGKIEAIYQGILTCIGRETDKQIYDNENRYHELTRTVAEAVGNDMRLLPEYIAAGKRKLTVGDVGIRGWLALKLPISPRKQAEINSQANWLVFGNPARTAIHSLFDAISDAAEEAASSRVSFTSGELVGICMDGNYLEHFTEDSGIGEEHMPRVLEVTAKTLAATAFQLSRQRALEPEYSGPPPYDYKSFEIFSRPERDVS